MPKALMLTMALWFALCGLAWLALAMETHWLQVRSTAPRRSTVSVLRVLGAAALVGSLLICLRTDHATMAALVWVMALAAAALTVAFTLAWRPRWLSWLVAWAK